MKNIFKLLAALFLTLSLTSCAELEIVSLPVVDDFDAVTGATPSGKLKVGLVTGLYSDMFTEIIKPLLEDMGYVIETFTYDDNSLPNVYLEQNQIDLNMFQHFKSLNNYKFENDAALSAIAEIPTAPMCIFSSEYSSLQQIEKGATISLPAESSELSRSLVILENAGLISLNPLRAKEKVGLGDIKSNPLGLKFSLMPAEDLAESLSDYKLTVVDVSYDANKNLKLSDAIYHEILEEDYMIIVAVRTDDLHAQFIRDIITVMNSDEFKSAFYGEDGAFSGFQCPPSFYQ